MIALGVLGACLAVSGVVLLLAVGAGALSQAPRSTSSTSLWTQTVDKFRAVSVRRWIVVLVAAGSSVASTCWVEPSPASRRAPLTPNASRVRLTRAGTALSPRSTLPDTVRATVSPTATGLATGGTGWSSSLLPQAARAATASRAGTKKAREVCMMGFLRRLKGGGVPARHRGTTREA